MLILMVKKITSLIMIQVFLVTNMLYPELVTRPPSRNNNKLNISYIKKFSRIYTPALLTGSETIKPDDNLRVKIMFSKDGDQDRHQLAIDIMRNDKYLTEGSMLTSEQVDDLIVQWTAEIKITVKDKHTKDINICAVRLAAHLARSMEGKQGMIDDILVKLNREQRLELQQALKKLLKTTITPEQRKLAKFFLKKLAYIEQANTALKLGHVETIVKLVRESSKDKRTAIIQYLITSLTKRPIVPGQDREDRDIRKDFDHLYIWSMLHDGFSEDAIKVHATAQLSLIKMACQGIAHEELSRITPNLQGLITKPIHDQKLPKWEAKELVQSAIEILFVFSVFGILEEEFFVWLSRQTPDIQQRVLAALAEKPYSYGVFQIQSIFNKLQGRSSYSLEAFQNADNKAKLYAALGIPEIGGKLRIYASKEERLGQIKKLAKALGLSTTAIHDYHNEKVLTLLLPSVSTADEASKLVEKVLKHFDLISAGLSVDYQVTFAGNLGDRAKSISLIHWLTAPTVYEPQLQPFKYRGDQMGLLIKGGGVTYLPHPAYSDRHGQRTDFRGRILDLTNLKHILADLNSLQLLVMALSSANKPAEDRKSWEQQLVHVFDEFETKIQGLLIDAGEQGKEVYPLVTHPWLVHNDGPSFMPRKGTWSILYPYLHRLYEKLTSPEQARKGYPLLEEFAQTRYATAEQIHKILTKYAEEAKLDQEAQMAVKRLMDGLGQTGSTTTSPSISSTGIGDERQANRNILKGILDIALKKGKIDNVEYNRRLEEFDREGGSLSKDIDLGNADDVNIFLINGERVIVIDGEEVLSTTEEGEQYASGGLTRGVIYITRSKFNEWKESGILEQKINHEWDELSYLRRETEKRGWSYEEMSRYLKNPDNRDDGKKLIDAAHKYADGREKLFRIREADTSI